MSTSQETGSATFYQTYYKGSIGLEDVSIEFAKQQKANLNSYITKIKTTNNTTNTGINLSDGYAKKLRDMLDEQTGGFGGKKQTTVTTRKVLEATSKSADVIAKIAKGEDVGVNATRVVLDIGGTLIGNIVPPPYGEALTSALGLLSTFLGIAIEKREPSLKDEIAALLRDFAYADLQAQYAAKIAEIKRLLTAVSEDLQSKDLPYRTSTTMEYATGLVSDTFETALKSWANSDCFKQSYFEDGKWKNKSAALGRAKIMNLVYEYVCTKKCLLQGLICLIETTKDQMRAKKMGPAKITPMDEHLHLVQIAYKNTDDSLRELLKEFFDKSATHETAAMYAALHVLPNFVNMRNAYSKLTGAAAKYPQPNTSEVLTRIVSRGLVPTGLGAKTLGGPGIKFRLRPDPNYPGCFRLVGEANIPWRENSNSTVLESVAAAGSFDQDRARFVFIGVTEKAAGTWFFITTRSIILNSSLELKTLCSSPFMTKNEAGYEVLHAFVDGDPFNQQKGTGESHYTLQQA